MNPRLVKDLPILLIFGFNILSLAMLWWAKAPNHPHPLWFRHFRFATRVFAVTSLSYGAVLLHTRVRPEHDIKIALSTLTLLVSFAAGYWGAVAVRSFRELHRSRKPKYPPPNPAYTCRFTCPDCGITSYHYMDVLNAFCARCGKFHGYETRDPEAVWEAIEILERIENLKSDKWTPENN